MQTCTYALQPSHTQSPWGLRTGPSPTLLGQDWGLSPSQLARTGPGLGTECPNSRWDLGLCAFGSSRTEKDLMDRVPHKRSRGPRTADCVHLRAAARIRLSPKTTNAVLSLHFPYVRMWHYPKGEIDQSRGAFVSPVITRDESDVACRHRAVPPPSLCERAIQWLRSMTS